LEGLKITMKNPLGNSIFRLRFEPETSQIQSGSANHPTVISGGLMKKIYEKKSE
jgi:hypothetical protein